jgi:hypothetical protein
METFKLLRVLTIVCAVLGVGGAVGTCFGKKDYYYSFWGVGIILGVMLAVISGNEECLGPLSKTQHHN